MRPSGLTRMRASSLSMSPSFTMSTAILNSAKAGPLARPRLEHPELFALDGELDVLHVLEMAFQGGPDLEELLVGFGHLFLEGWGGGVRFLLLVDGKGRPRSGHHVFALGIEEILAVEDVLSRRRVSREGDTRARILAYVAENHGLYVDGRSP